MTGLSGAAVGTAVLGTSIDAGASATIARTSSGFLSATLNDNPPPMLCPISTAGPVRSNSAIKASATLSVPVANVSGQKAGSTDPRPIHDVMACTFGKAGPVATHRDDPWRCSYRRHHVDYAA